MIGSVAYSAYAEVQSVTSEFKQGNGGAATETLQGAGAVVSANFTIPNNGLYPLNVTVTCLHSQSSANVYCQPASVMVKPGQSDTLRILIHVQDLAAYTSSADKSVNGTLDINMPPFASLSMAVDMSSLLGQGSG